MYMGSSMNAKTFRNVLAWVIILVALAYVLQAAIYKPNGDDGYFSKALDNRGLFDFLQGRYYSWSGRVFIEALLVKTINISYIPYVIISFSLLLMSYGLSYFFYRQEDRTSIGMAIAIMAVLMNYHSVNQAVTWITGAYNYVLPISIGVIAFVLKDYHEKNQKAQFLVASCIAIFFACNNEQFGIAALMFCLSVLTFKVLNKQPVKHHILFTLACLISVVIVLIAPGNASRFASEIVNWMPDFNDYGINVKAALSVDRINNHLLNTENILYFVCCLLMVINILKQIKIDSTDYICIALVIPVLFNFIFQTYPHRSGVALILSGDYANPDNWLSWKLYASYIISFMSISALCVHSLRLRPDGLLTLLLILGVASLAMIGLSPTAYESGTRVAFILDISLASYAISSINSLTSRE